GEHALTAWQAVINSTILLHESPHGYQEPMRGRYAFLSDRPELVREGIERLRNVLAVSGERLERVVATPSRQSRIVALAAAELLGLPFLDWSPGAERQGLVVAWSLDSVSDGDFLKALHPHGPGQRLFVHASCWTDPFPYAPDVTTLLYQTITDPWTGGA